MDVEQLIVSNLGWIRNYAHKFYSNERDAADLASETIFKCLTYACRFDEGKSFKPWVVAIMANTFKTQYARRKCVTFACFEDTFFGEDYADQLADFNHLVSVIRECSRKSRCIACVLLYAKGYSYEEISEITKVPVGTVKSRVFAGRKILRKALS